MKNKFFIKSQEIKREIEKDSSLIKNLKETFENPKDNMKLGEGSKSRVYRIDKISKDLWGALYFPGNEKFKIVGPDIYEKWYEEYCYVAENISDGNVKINMRYSNENVPQRGVSFCVGVYYNEIPGIVLEDISEGGKCKLRKYASVSVVKLNKAEEQIEEVIVDLSVENFGISFDKETRKYFLKENRIDLK